MLENTAIKLWDGKVGSLCLGIRKNIVHCYKNSPSKNLFVFFRIVVFFGYSYRLNTYGGRNPINISLEVHKG